MHAFIHWLPRILSLVFAAFISVFALDVFTSPFEPVMLVGLLIHLLPTFALLAISAVAWRYELVGAVGFLSFTAWYVWATAADVPWPWYMIIAGPTVVIGALYLASWWYSRSIATRADAEATSSDMSV